MIFRISHPDRSHISYLLGTMHAQSTVAFTFYKEANELMGLCSTFVSEIDLSDPSFLNIQSLFYLPDQKDLSHYFSLKKLNKMRNQIQLSFDVDIFNFVNMQPIFTINQILSQFPDRTYPKPLDIALYEQALSRGMSIDGLETYEDQVNIISRLIIEDQMLQLRKLAQKPDKARKKVLKLANHYQNGRIKEIYHLSRSGLLSYRNALLKDRNQSMAKQLVIKTEKNSCFFAVGAAHLYGKNGLIHLVKQKGFQVKKYH